MGPTQVCVGPSVDGPICASWAPLQDRLIARWRGGGGCLVWSPGAPPWRPPAPGSSAATPDATGRMLVGQPGAAEGLRRVAAVDPDFAPAHAGLALLHHRAGRVESAWRRLERAGRAASRATNRERSHVQALAAVIEGRRSEARRHTAAHLRRWPTDALLVHEGAEQLSWEASADPRPARLTFLGALAPHYRNDRWFGGDFAFDLVEERSPGAGPAPGPRRSGPQSAPRGGRTLPGPRPVRDRGRAGWGPSAAVLAARLLPPGGGAQPPHLAPGPVRAGPGARGGGDGRLSAGARSPRPAQPAPLGQRLVPLAAPAGAPGGPPALEAGA